MNSIRYSNRFAIFLLALGGLILFNFVGQMAAQTSFKVTPALALQTSFPGKEGYQYQIESSPNLTNWIPATGRRLSIGATETFAFGITNSPGTFYRATEFPPDLTRWMPGLREVYFDNASLNSRGGTIIANGIRVVSTDYNLNDYIQAAYAFDLARQILTVSQIRVFSNVGLTCGKAPVFFLKDVPSHLSIQVGGQSLNDYTLYTLPASGQAMTMNVVAGQVLSLIVNPVAENVLFEVQDSSGVELGSYSLIPGTIRNFIGPFNFYKPEVIKLRFSPDRGTTQVSL